MRSTLTGAQFAAWGGMFSTIDCCLVAIRKKVLFRLVSFTTILSLGRPAEFDCLWRFDRSSFGYSFRSESYGRVCYSRKCHPRNDRRSRSLDNEMDGINGRSDCSSCKFLFYFPVKLLSSARSLGRSAQSTSCQCSTRNRFDDAFRSSQCTTQSLLSHFITL